MMRIPDCVANPCPTEEGRICVATIHPRYCVLARDRPEFRAIVRAGGRLPDPPKTDPMPLPSGTLIVRGHHGVTGYGRMARFLFRAIVETGHPAVFDPIDGPGVGASRFLVSEPCFQMSSPWAVNRPGNVLFSMFESSRLPEQSVATYNQARAVVVPCRWNSDVFRSSGVDVPIRVVPLGVDTTVFHPNPERKTGNFVILSVAALSSGGHRKRVPSLVAAFLEALGDRPDARLILKIAPDDVFDPPDHPRVIVDPTAYDDAGLARLYRSADVYATMTCGEGWGMPILEAMACGLPIVTPIHTGIADFVRESFVYPVSWTTEPARGAWYEGHGDWFPPDHDSMVRQLRAAYAEPSDRMSKGQRAAAHAAEFSWERSARELLIVLDEFGLIHRASDRFPGGIPPVFQEPVGESIDPRVRDAVLRCEYRGREGGLILREDEKSCCNSGEERTECRAGKGRRPGRPTLRECLACKAEVVA